MKTFHALPVMFALVLQACIPGGVDDYGDMENSSSTTAVPSGTTLRVTSTSLNLRSGPATSYSILEVLGTGAKVTAVETTGSTGWLHVKAASGKIGWASATYLTVVDTTTLPTCDPARAVGAVNAFQKALHDSIAYAEGTRNYSKDGYNVMFSFKLMSTCNVHPNQCIAFGSTCSTAAGRYQYLKTSWDGVASALKLTTFEPDSQERAAQYTINTVRKVTVPTTRAMTATEFSNAMSKLSYEWASLPPGRYGQPTKTSSQMWTMYCSLAGC